MPKKLYDLAVVTGQYTDKSGKQRNNYENIGAVFESDKDGKPYMMLKATFNPAGIHRKEGSTSILVSLFAPKDKSSRDNAVGQAKNSNYAPDFNNYDNDVPF